MTKAMVGEQFAVRVLTVNILGFASHMVSVTTIQLCHYTSIHKQYTHK